MDIDNYIKGLRGSLLKMQINDDKGKVLSQGATIAKIINLIITHSDKGNKVIFIGNGGSASIASHIAIDLLKNAQISAMAFNDPSLITCLSNDLGYEYVFQKPLELLAKKGDILFSLSSSGKSKNILNATEEAKKKGCFLVTLSGFAKDNPLRKLGNINFYIPSNSYGYVEIAHTAICHCIVDGIIKERKLNG